MKVFLRAWAVFLLMLVAVLTLARRENSGWIAFSGDSAEGSNLYMMTANGRSVRQITRGQLCRSILDWSPDGRWIAYRDFCDGGVYFLHVQPGGSKLPTTLQEPYNLSTATWSPDGERLIVARPGQKIYVVDAHNANERLLAEDVWQPYWSPDGQWIYVRASTTPQFQYMLYRIHAETGHMQTVLQQGFPFSGFALSPDGQQILLAQSVDSGSHLMLMAPDGSEQRVIPFDPPISIRYPCWSPDGEWIAFAGTSENEGTYVYRVRPDGSDLQRLTDTPTQIGDLQWSPDEMWLLFTIIEEAYVGIIRLHPDGSGLERMTVPALYASNPHYAPVAGLRWRPVWLIVAAVGMGLASLRRSSPK